jgi:hypothetical protein
MKKANHKRLLAHLGLAAAFGQALFAIPAIAGGLGDGVQGDLIVAPTPASAPAVQGDLISPAPAAAGPVVAAAQTATPSSPPVATPAAAASSNAVAWSLSDLTKAVVDDSAKRAHDTAGFDKLSAFTFKTTDDMVLGMADALTTSQDIASQIPASVKALNHKDVTVTGFMMPTKVEDGRATEFLLLKNQGLCCYGTQPAMNEYVTVRMAGKGVKPVLDRLITVSGQLRVGELRENHLLVGIYRLDADKCDAPEE